MLPLHRPLLAAPLALLLACNVTVNGSAGEETTTGNDDTNNTTQPSTNDPSNSTVPTTTTPTTEPDPTTSSSSTTTDGTTGGDTTTADPSASSSTGEDTDPGPTTACMLTDECAEGEACWAPYDPNTMGPGDFTCKAECVDDKGDGNSEDAWCSDDASCCSPDATCDQTGYCLGGGGGESTGTDTDTDTDTGTSGTDTEASSTGDSSTGDTDTGGGLLPTITLTGFVVTGNCMPQVPNDPIVAKWSAVFDNSNGVVDLTAIVSAATLTYDPGANEFVQDISVSPTSSGVVMASKSVTKAMTKTAALDDLPMDCSQCGNMVELEILFDVSGVPVIATAEAELTCAF